MSTKNDNEDLTTLLRAVGARTEPDPEMRDRVYQAALQEWQDLPDHQSTDGKLQADSGLRRILAMAASVALIGVLVSATLLNVSDATQIGEIVHAAGGNKQSGTVLQDGQAVGTGEGEYVAIRLGTGVHLRLDEHTQVVLDDPQKISMSKGRVYVDAQVGQLKIITPHVQLVDIGTIYQVQTDQLQSQVWMREGRVDLAFGEQLMSISSHEGLGDYVKISKDAELLSRDSIKTTADAWLWQRDARAPFNLHGQSVAQYMQWLARDSGVELQMASPAVAQMAQLEDLGGTPGQTSDDFSRDQILQTTGFRVVETDDHTWMLDFRED